MKNDLIPRSAVKEKLKAVKEKGNIFISIGPDKETRPHAFVVLRKALNTVDAIPAVEAETEPQEKATWLGAEYDGYADGHPVYNSWQCSNCREEIDGYEGFPPPFKYCPFCGMEIEEDEQ